jgi:cupin 2 domain-containing protein
VARHSESQDELVVYRQEYGERRLWVRPAGMFAATVEVAGRQVPRFQYLGGEPARESGGTANLFADLPEKLPEEIVQTIVSASHVRIERIVSHGQVSPAGFWYDQPESEFVVVLAGAARLRFEGDEPFDLAPGDYVNIAAHCRHRVEWTAPDETTIWLAVFYS